MKDGFYLSTYLNPTGLPRLLNTWLRHDENLSLWEKHGNQVLLHHHWELERTTGMKEHGVAMLGVGDARAFVNGLLETYDLTLDDMAEVWGTPGLSTIDDVRTARSFNLPYHSMAHLYSAMLLDSDLFFDGTILGLAVDACPDWVIEPNYKKDFYAGAVAHRGELDTVGVESPGTLFQEARRYFGMREGTLMALATATRAVGRSDRAALLEEFSLFGDHTPSRLVRLVARDMFEQTVEQVAAGYSVDPEFGKEESFASAVMKEIQALSVGLMERNVERLLDRSGVDPGTTYLALSGGYALNCPTNSHLMNKYGFRGFLAPPCVDDRGQSMGMALATFHQAMEGHRFDFTFPGPYLGGADDLEEALADHADFISEASDFDHATCVSDIVSGPIAWFNGRSEIGPRALGNRSILADPTSYAAKAALNNLKRRQWWRPVAPVVLEEHLAEWFENARPSPYMLETFLIREGRRGRIPAVAHLDYSARVQSVTHTQNPLLYELVRAFYGRTGVPMLCNTSLNDKGEPIVETIPQAINFCLRRGVQVGYINGRRIVFKNFASYPADRPLPRAHERFSAPLDVRVVEEIRQNQNPHGLPDSYLRFLLSWHTLRVQHDVTDFAGATEFRRAADEIFTSNPEIKELFEAEVGGKHFAPDGAIVGDLETT